MKKLLSILFLILSITEYCAGNKDFYTDYQFKYLTMEHGLSNYKVNAIYRDSSDYVWFGTNEGLNRYDGLIFKVFKHDPENPTSISSNKIRKILKADNNQLVIATDQGINFYNHEKETFRTLSYSDTVYQDDIIWSISFDQEGDLWIGSKHGLFYLKKGENKIQNFSSIASWYKDYEVREVYCVNNIIYIGTQTQGLYIYDKSFKIYKHFKHEPYDPASISGNWIEAIFEDRNKKIWIGTNNNGLCTYEPLNDNFTRIKLPISDFSNMRVRDFAEDNRGRIWIGTFRGLFLKNSNSDSIYLFAHSDYVNSELINNSIYDIFIDNQEIMWLGTYSGGVNYCDMNQKKFKYHESKQNDNRYLNDRVVFSIVEGENDILWIGTERGGINKFNRVTQTYDYYTYENFNIGNNIKTIFPDYNNNLWFGTYNSGLYYFEPDKNTFQNFVHDTSNDKSIRSNAIYSIAIDNNENLWIGTISGVDMLPKNSNEFIHIKQKGRELEVGAINSLFKDSKGNIWMGGSVNGLWRLDFSDSSFVFYDEKMTNTGLYTICEDKKGNIWTGGNNGIFYINTTDNNIINYTEKDGLSSNTIYKVIDDNEGNIWISSTTGLSKFENAVHTPESNKIIHYNSTDGTNIRQFTFNSYYKSKSGEIFIGGVDGFISFYPQNISKNQYKPKVKITNFKIFNNDISIGEKINDNIILEKAIEVTKEITLSYRLNIFTVEFAALHFANPKNNMYAYTLEGFEKKWNYTSADKPFATYTNLNGGNYTFKVKGANSDGIWNDEITTLKIKVTPPFWKSNWFLVLLSFILVLIVVLIIQYRTLSLNKQKVLLEKMVNERTFELSKAKDLLEEKQQEIINKNSELENHRNNLEEKVNRRTVELEKARLRAEESDRLKTSFLANISHEVRTPLNAILGFTQLLIRKKEPKEKEKYIQLINNNSDTLLVLFNDILDISKIESRQIDIHNVKFNIESLLKQFESTYKLKNINDIEVCFKNNNEPIKIRTDISRFKQIINNLLNNALKYTEKGYVNFGYTVKDNFIEFYVEDTGIGISKEKYQSIFNYFEKIEDDKSKLFRGTGIGLSICKRLIEMMGGEIWLNSELNKGTTFFFTLPFDPSIQEGIPNTISLEKNQGFKKLQNIIIAEDEDSNFHFLSKLLDDMGISIMFWAKNGEELVEFINLNKGFNNCAILMDIKMPVMNGIEAFKEIRKNNKIPIAAVTAYVTEADKKIFYDMKFDGIISKPIYEESLYSCLHNIDKKL